MAVSREDVEHVARLARLQLDAREIERLTHELNDILGHVEELAAADFAEGTEDAPATPLEAVTPLRADDGVPDPLEVAPSAFAPAWEDGFFALPRLDALGGDGAT